MFQVVFSEWEYGRTQCSITTITAAYTWAGLSRWKLTMGTQHVGRRTWIMQDPGPREGTIRRILSLLSGRNGDRTSLMARLTTTPWIRKKQAMVRERVCCLLVLNSVTSTKQCIRQPEAAWF
jgi:hypothetical protein